jgi:glycerol-3-phosphate dehydrogenase (NAD(P)+)
MHAMSDDASRGDSPHTDIPRSVTVLGPGQMGLVMAAIAAAEPAVERVTLWCHTEREAEEIGQRRTSPRLRVFELDARVHVTPDPKRALLGRDADDRPADMIVNAIPSQFIREVWNRLLDACPNDDRVLTQRVVSVSKGLENGSLLTPLGVIAEVTAQQPGWSRDGHRRPLAVLSGPTIASELARGLPATMVSASVDDGLAIAAQHTFTTNYLRVYTNDDVAGVEVAGACKNVIAIAAGIIDGLKAGYNAKSALLARGLAEIARLGVAMGAQAETFSGLAGAGDLATTCFSPEGRNRSLGEALGRGEKLSDYLERTSSVVEGVATAESVMALKDQFSVDMPICTMVHAVLKEEIDPLDGIAQLMQRALKEERVG